MTTAKARYEAYLKEASQHHRLKVMARQRVKSLENDIASLHEQIAGLERKASELAASAATDAEAEAEFEANANTIEVLKRQLKGKQQILDAAKDVANEPGPNELQGRELLAAYCDEEARALLRDKKRVINEASKHLQAAFVRWAYMGGDWDAFLSEVLPGPSDEELEKLSTKFYRDVLRPLEERYSA